jgi:pimeloyl-ACP methyl ester carboxylesterase
VNVVYLHALPLDERMWPAAVHAPRLYGPGRTMDQWAEAILDAYPGPLILVGASMGGYCALAAARLAPERMAGLVLAGARPDADSPQRRARRAETIALARARGAEGIWEAMRELLFTPEADPELLDRARTMALDRTEDELVTAIEAIRDRPDSTAAFRALGDRTLTIVGDRDPYLSVRDARGFDANAVILPDCSHLPSLERPAEFNLVLEEALARWS